MNNLKIIALLLAAGASIMATSAKADVVLVEQAVNFKLKLTTLAVPTAKPVYKNGELVSASANLKTVSGTVTTKDILTTMGYSKSAKLIARLIHSSGTEVYLQIVVADKINGVWVTNDVTPTLQDLIPADNPIQELQNALHATGVAKGTISVNGSTLKVLGIPVPVLSLTASLQTLSYGQGQGAFYPLQIPVVGAANLSMNVAGLSTGTISLSAKPVIIPGIPLLNIPPTIGGYVTLGLSTTTKAVGSATLGNFEKLPSLVNIPGVLEGTVTTTGKSTKIPISDVVGLIDMDSLQSQLEALTYGFLD